MAQSRNTMEIAADDLMLQAATADGIPQEVNDFHAKANELSAEIHALDLRLKLIDSTLICIVTQLKKTIDGIAICDKILTTVPVDFAAFNLALVNVKEDYYHLKKLRREQYDEDLDIAPSDKPVRMQLTELKNASFLCEELENKLNQLYGVQFEDMCQRQEKMLDALEQCQTDFYAVVEKARGLAKEFLHKN